MDVARCKPAGQLRAALPTTAARPLRNDMCPGTRSRGGCGARPSNQFYPSHLVSLQAGGLLRVLCPGTIVHT